MDNACFWYLTAFSKSPTSAYAAPKVEIQNQDFVKVIDRIVMFAFESIEKSEPPHVGSDNWLKEILFA